MRRSRAGARHRFVLAGFVVALFVMAVMTRWTASSPAPGGEIVTSQPTVVVQSLDPAIIKAINVREGQRVKAGDVLAALDPTFANRRRRRAQAANRRTRRSNGALRGRAGRRPYNAAANNRPGAARYGELQKALYQQRKGQYDDQIRAYNSQIAQVSATIAKLENNMSRYADRAKLAKEVEQMRATLAAAQVGSRLALLGATDQKTETVAQSRIRPEQSCRKPAPAAGDDSDPAMPLPSNGSPRPARNWSRPAISAIRRGSNSKRRCTKRIWWQLTATEDSVVLRMGQAIAAARCSRKAIR